MRYAPRRKKFSFWTPIAALLLLGVDVQPASAAAAPFTITSFSTTYTAYDPDGAGPNPRYTFGIKYWAPTTPGNYPIFIAMSGTGKVLSDGVWNTTTQEAAKRGMIAAEVGWDSDGTHACGCDGNRTGSVNNTTAQYDCSAPYDKYVDKSKAIFNNADPNSALRRIIAHTSTHAAKALLSKGIAVLGLSQTSYVAHLAEQWTTKDGIPSGGTAGKAIAAGWLIGTGRWQSVNCSSQGVRLDIACNAFNAAGVIPPANLRVHTGEYDVYFSRGIGLTGCPGTFSAANTRLNLYEVTGGCNGTTADFCSIPAGNTANAGGWRLIRNSMLTNPPADHGFYAGFKGPQWGTTKTVAGPSGWTRADTLNWIARKLGSPAIQL